MEVLNKYLEVDGVMDVAKYCLDHGKYHVIKRDKKFILQNQTCNEVAFIKTGAFKYLRTSSSGVKYVVGYTFENDFVTDYCALQMDHPASFAAQAMRDSEIYAITKDQLNHFFEKYGKGLRHRISEAFLSDIYGRLLTLHCEPPEERYLILVQRFPNILNQASLKEIASFIKIAPETLSRIRKKLLLGGS